MEKRNRCHLALRRGVSLLLALAMAGSLCLESLAVQAAPEENLPDGVSGIEELPGEKTDPSVDEPEHSSDPAGPPSEAQETEPPAEEGPADELETPETRPEEPDTPEEGTEGESEPLPGGAADGEVPADVLPDIPEEDEQEMSEPTVEWTEASLQLSYDDRYSFDETWTGYEILEITTDSVTSYQVSRGSVTGQRDREVLTLQSGGQTEVTASGVGQATVVLAPSDRLEEARAVLDGEVPAVSAAPEQPIELVRVTVTVSAARLTVMFLLGQSNMRGASSDVTGSHPEDSVLCQDGEVYTTQVVANVGDQEVETCIPGALQGNRSLTGSVLPMRIDALTSAGRGKTGPDSGLAYEWNRLTGDKVWTVNAAYSATSITQWEPGQRYYRRAETAISGALRTLQAEITAGHYTEGHRLAFWLQGETDYALPAQEYLSSFRAFYDGMAGLTGMEKLGIIIPRASSGSCTDEDDLVMTGPRIAQYYIGASSQYPDVYVVSNINEQWVTDEGVRSYFQKAYPGGELTYPLRANSTLSGLPTRVSQVHGDIHYAQVGHNENGLDAARSMYYIIYGGGASVSSISWHSAEGGRISSLTVAGSTSAVAVPVVTPVYRAKDLRISTNGVSYEHPDGTLVRTGSGDGTLWASAGGVSATLQVNAVNSGRTPELWMVRNVDGGVEVNWHRLQGASRYRVYRRTLGGSWQALAYVNGTSYTDRSVAAGTAYTYTVRAVINSSLAGYDPDGLTIYYLPAPTASLGNAIDGVQVRWNLVSGALGYEIYRYHSGTGEWELKGKVQNAGTSSWVDTDVSAGQQVSYVVRAMRGSAHSANSARASGSYLAAPVLGGAASASGGVRVTWTAVTGATGYRVYRRNGGSGWQQIAQLSGGSLTSYIDRSAASGTRYGYTVRSVRGNSPSAYYSGVFTVHLATPRLSRTQALDNGVRITWETVSDALAYRVYRRTEAGSWAFVAQVEGGQSNTYLDTSGTAGVVYYYTVRARQGDYLSYYDTAGLIGLWLETPTLRGAEAYAGGVRVTWSQVRGAEGYNIYRRTEDGSWQMIAQLSGSSTASYIDQTARENTVYRYTVRARRSGRLSGYVTQGVRLLYLATPAMRGAVNASGGLRVTWGSVPGATSYRLYRRTSGGWEQLAVLSGNTYTDTTVRSGTSYAYTVRALCRDGGGEQKSYFQTDGVSARYLAVPALRGAQSEDGGVRVSWTAVDGAAGYRVYRKTAGTSWRQVATCSGGGTSTWLDRGLTAGTVYTYTVRAVNGSALSYYQTAGVSARCLATPVLGGVSNTDGGLRIRWQAVTGATGYRLYRKTADSGWTAIARLSGNGATSYLDTNVISGTRYLYTVRALEGSGKSYFDADGVGATRLATPVLRGAQSVGGGVRVTWDRVPGATGYTLYRKRADGAWTAIAQISGGGTTSYTDTGVSAGTADLYTVRAKGGGVLSDYDRTGVSASA